MTDLQTSLIVIGGVIVVGVISYNKWQEHKARKTVERAFASSDHDDVLMHADGATDAESGFNPDFNPGFKPPVAPAAAFSPAPVAVTKRGAPSAADDFDDERVEPELYQAPERRPPAMTAEAALDIAAAKMAANAYRDIDSDPEHADGVAEPYLSLDTAADSHHDYPVDPHGAHDSDADLGHVSASLADPAVQAAAAAAAAAAPAVQRELPVDELVDCIIPIALELSVRGDKILPGVQNLRHVGNKTVNFVGRTVAGEWEAISHGSVYNALLAGVQLANRNNALNELEYSELIMRLREFTDAIGAEPEVPDMIDVMKTAQALHQFIMDHDVQLGVNVRSNGAPWNVTTLLAALTRQGFDRRSNSNLVMQDGEGEVLFSISTNVTGAAETTDRLTLLLDVPRVGPVRDGYGALIACARSLAMRLGGTVVDDSDQLLSDAALSDIAEQVGAFYSAMESAEIPAGSKRAIRLFS
jgi:FtsZ-interacting cell division protein ZipA